MPNLKNELERIIRVSSCYACPGARCISLPELEIECLRMDEDDDSDVTKYYKNKTFHPDCSLEKVKQMIVEVKEP